tara:strand:- start:858 stop:1058 length:201 start_codon:yes stop_codon:yes gene_type:complete
MDPLFIFAVLILAVAVVVCLIGCAVYAIVAWTSGHMIMSIVYSVVAIFLMAALLFGAEALNQLFGG